MLGVFYRGNIYVGLKFCFAYLKLNSKDKYSYINLFNDQLSHSITFISSSKKKLHS